MPFEESNRAIVREWSGEKAPCFKYIFGGGVVPHIYLIKITVIVESIGLKTIVFSFVCDADLIAIDLL